MSLVTLTKVADDHRTFDTKHGQKVSFKVWEGEKVGEVTTNPETLEKRRAEFRAIVGVPTELVVQDQGSFPDGSPKPWKLSFPKEQQGGGGKRDYTPRWTDTEEGAKWADDRINRRRALELAIQYHGDLRDQGHAPGLVMVDASEFYTFLKSADIEPATSTVTSPETGGMVDADGGSPVEGEAAGGPSTTDPRKDFRRYLAETYTTADAVLMARTLFQTKVRKVPNLMGLELEELQAIDAEFKARKIEAPA